MAWIISSSFVRQKAPRRGTQALKSGCNWGIGDEVCIIFSSGQTSRSASAMRTAAENRSMFVDSSSNP